jgi:predicted DNA-binding transcriptional regulator AlpA
MSASSDKFTNKTNLLNVEPAEQLVVVRSSKRNAASNGSSVRPSAGQPCSATTAAMDERYFSDKTVCARYDVSRQTIWQWLKKKETFPAPIRFSDGTTRWKLSDLLAYEAALGSSHVSDDGGPK